MIIDLNVAGIDAAMTAVARKQEEILKGLQIGIRHSGEMLAKVARKHLRVARKISQQDAPQARKLGSQNPVSLSMDPVNLRATVGIGAYYASVREGGNTARLRPEIAAILARDEYTRTELKIERLMVHGKGRHPGPDTQPLKAMSLSRPWLAQWAEDERKGRQSLRHVVRIARADALERLAMDPALREVEPIITRLLRTAVERGVASA